MNVNEKYSFTCEMHIFNIHLPNVYIKNRIKDTYNIILTCKLPMNFGFARQI